MDAHPLATTAPTRSTGPTGDQPGQTGPTGSPADGLAVSASELVKLIRSGQGADVNRLVDMLLSDRDAA